jgi:hypothetical protein
MTNPLKVIIRQKKGSQSMQLLIVLWRHEFMSY